MIRRIYKYPVRIDDKTSVTMPLGARILNVHEQMLSCGRSGAFLWALVDPSEKEMVTRRVRIAGTGHDIDDAEKLAYCGTFHLSTSGLVFHLLEYL